ncbi:hypothetical protein FGIG_12364 [Fasciola gigantica]|uniref:Uncharacterized protein n=1 Tax=Fasciola gigantica TaxID=46835 RepID=A0A504YCA7_FASGI|nr:hypothetical protein FGIG_12364 [Fasciola gigantica]
MEQSGAILRTENTIKLNFINSANCILLAFESHKKMTRSSTLMFRISLGPLEIHPITDCLIRPELQLTQQSTDSSFSIRLGNCLKNVRLIPS